MKNFIVTVDTEGDNLWAWRPGEEITVENTKYIPRFQGLCEKYGFCPVYLTNNEMIESDEFCAFLKQKHLKRNVKLGCTYTLGIRLQNTISKKYIAGCHTLRSIQKK